MPELMRRPWGECGRVRGPFPPRARIAVPRSAGRRRLAVQPGRSATTGRARPRASRPGHAAAGRPRSAGPHRVAIPRGRIALAGGGVMVAARRGRALVAPRPGFGARAAKPRPGLDRRPGPGSMAGPATPPHVAALRRRERGAPARLISGPWAAPRSRRGGPPCRAHGAPARSAIARRPRSGTPCRPEGPGRRGPSIAARLVSAVPCRGAAGRPPGGATVERGAIPGLPSSDPFRAEEWGSKGEAGSGSRLHDPRRRWAPTPATAAGRGASGLDVGGLVVTSAIRPAPMRDRAPQLGPRRSPSARGGA